MPTQLATIKERRQNGFCGCGRKPRAGLKTCDVCAARWDRKRANAIKRNKCVECGKPQQTRRRCEKCYAAVQKRRHSRAKDGLCPCGNLRFENRKLCEKCLQNRINYARRRFFFIRAITFNHNNRPQTPLTALDLFSLWKKQKGICSLTGVKLDAENAAIDHIIPASLGGAHDCKNLRFVTKEVNHAKNNLLDTDFLSLCFRVTRTIGPQ